MIPPPDPVPREQELHARCHDVVCNASRQHPRGDAARGCSCGGRDAARAELAALRSALSTLVQQWEESVTHYESARAGDWEAIARLVVLEMCAEELRACLSPTERPQVYTSYPV
jgi:hypothetical protein